VEYTRNLDVFAVQTIENEVRAAGYRAQTRSDVVPFAPCKRLRHKAVSGLRYSAQDFVGDLD
jgi:hypothetical protein